MAKTEHSYSKAIAEIETILSKIENGETDIDNLAADIKRASMLLQGCKEKLLKTEQEVNKIVMNEQQ